MNDYPPTLAGSHGRIAAYRAALAEAAVALQSATPYVYNVTRDQQPWRRETAAQVMDTLRSARDRIEAELAVTTDAV